jgi:hypothetical protein
VTKNLQERHEISTSGNAETSILILMRGAFIVQVRKVSRGMAGHIEGLVEEVDTGKQSQFHSARELIGFLRDRFARIQSPAKEEGTDERNDHGL